MADLTTTIHETIEQHRYAVPAGEMSYRPGDPICSCGWRPPKPNGELHSRHVATEVARAVLACLQADALRDDNDTQITATTCVAGTPLDRAALVLTFHEQGDRA